MTTNIGTTGRRGLWSGLIWTSAAGLILLPFVAMQFTREVNWDADDFIFAGVMIGGSCVVLELVLRLAGSWAYRGGAAVALGAAFLIVWINAAVGIIGEPDNPRNLWYGVILAVALGGAIGAGFRAAGMARAMTAAAVTLALCTLAVATAPHQEPPGAAGIAMINGFFLILFAGSALLFRRAAREERDD